MPPKLLPKPALKPRLPLTPAALQPKPTLQPKPVLQPKPAKIELERNEKGELKAPKLNENSPELIAQRAKVVETVVHRSRGYRYKAGNLGSSLSLAESDKRQILQGTDVDPKRIGITKKLYGKHPATRAMSSAAATLREWVYTRTKPHAEPGVRILIVKQNIPASAPAEEIKADIAAQMEAFENGFIAQHREFQLAIAKLQSEWPNVLDFARQELRSKFDPRDYPRAEELPQLITASLEPYNTALPEEYQLMSPEARERALAVQKAQFEIAIRKQEEVLMGAVAQSFTGFINSLQSMHDGKQKSMKNSPAANVLSAIKQWQSDLIEYGIMGGSKLTEIVQDVDKYLAKLGKDEQTVMKTLKGDATQQQAVINKLTTALSMMAAQGQAEQQRRKIMVPKPLVTETAT